MSQYTSRPQDNAGNEFDEAGPMFPGSTIDPGPGMGWSGMGMSGTDTTGTGAMTSNNGLLHDPRALRLRWESVQVGFVDDPR